MLKKVKEFGFLSVMILGTLSNLNAADKMYIDSAELNFAEDAFYIHIGENLWIETNTVHRDASGLYTFEIDIKRGGAKAEYEQKWKCPYCHHYWPMGQGCQNKNCPSRFPR